MSSTAMDTLTSYYNAFMAGQANDDYFLYSTSMTSADWAAWHSGPTSDIPNMLAYQQSAMEYSLQQFLAEGDAADAARHQKEAIATAYTVDRAGALMSQNPSLSFNDALNLVAASVKADPSDLVHFAQAMVNGLSAGGVELVTVNGTYDPYGNSIVTYGTTGGQSGQLSGQGTLGANAPDHTLYGLEVDDSVRLTNLLDNITGKHHATPLHIVTTLTDMNGKSATLTKYVTPDGHIVDTLNVYVATLSDSNGLGIVNVFFDTRQALNDFLRVQWASGNNNWNENYGQTPGGPHGPNESMLFAGAANPGWSGSILKSIDLLDHHYEFMVKATDWVEINYQHEDAHAEHGAFTEDQAWLYAYQATDYIAH
jgi:hypothetical protein